MTDGLLFSEDDFESSALRFDTRYLNESGVLHLRTHKIFICNGSTSRDAAVGYSSSAATVLTNPCKDFAFPPPPPNRRPGPRRRFCSLLYCFAYLLE